MDTIKNLQFYSALFGAKAASKLLHLYSKNAGTSFPGVAAFKIDKDFLKDSSKFCNKKIITITGTNGKTTTSGIIATILKEQGENVLHNQKGANMPQGIATAIALGINPFKKADYFVLENDEAYLSKVYDQINADYLVVTNLFHDQLDRYGEIETTAKKIRTAIDKNPNLTILLNADDPMLKTLYTDNTITYGFESIEIVENTTQIQKSIENIYCTCKNKFKYSQNFYGHLGHYKCPCGYTRPTPQINATAKIYHDKSILEVNYNNSKFTFEAHIPGLYNAYNALAAIAVALSLNVKSETIQKAFDHYKSAFGRAEKLQINGKNVFIQLIKNPVGASEVIHTICNDKDSKLLIAINDEYADGRDISWLWDTDFEAFENYPNTIYTTGNRANDMALRLKYTNYKSNKLQIIPNIEEALNKAFSELEQNETLHILPSYTTLLTMQNLLKKL